MRAIQVAKFAGIPIKIHWSFGLFILLLIGYGLSNNINGLDLLWFIGFVGALFVCVILHEYGHALSARKYGVKTIDIIISPIGGLARLERLPRKPIQELVVAIAGPMVNVVLGVLIFVILFAIHQDFSFLNIGDNLSSNTNLTSFFGLLIWMNAVLFFFNLIPAFPMDGGRILRALLTMKLGRVKGTQWAARIGRLLAVVFIIYAILAKDYMVIFIGIFVFVMAGSESHQVLIESILEKAKASDIMNVNFSRIHLSDFLIVMYNKYVRGGEKNYLIFDSMGNLSGTMPELFLKQVYKEGKLENTTANEYMSRNILIVDHELNLKSLFELMNEKGVAIAAIEEDGDIQGVIDRNMLRNYIQLNKGNSK